MPEVICKSLIMKKESNGPAVASVGCSVGATSAYGVVVTDSVKLLWPASSQERRNIGSTEIVRMHAQTAAMISHLMKLRLVIG